MNSMEQQCGYAIAITAIVVSFLSPILSELLLIQVDTESFF